MAINFLHWGMPVARKADREAKVEAEQGKLDFSLVGFLSLNLVVRAPPPPWLRMERLKVQPRVVLPCIPIVFLRLSALLFTKDRLLLLVRLFTQQGPSTEAP